MPRHRASDRRLVAPVRNPGPLRIWLCASEAQCRDRRDSYWAKPRLGRMVGRRLGRLRRHECPARRRPACCRCSGSRLRRRGTIERCVSGPLREQACGDRSRHQAELSTQVGCDLALDVASPATIVLAVAPARSAGSLEDERFVITRNGEPLTLTPRRLDAPHAAYLHVVELPVGQVNLQYAAQLVDGDAPMLVASDEAELLMYRRPSRFCPSDRLVGFAAAELSHLAPGREQLDALVAWVARRLAYVSGSSRSLDTAIETLLAGQGVCRDYAHLVVAMCRALEMPARCASVYAPGLWPMDFHAVAEVHVDRKSVV